MNEVEQAKTVEQILPFSKEIVGSIKGAWTAWLGSNFIGKWTPRGRASFVWETTVFDLKEKFNDVKGVEVIDTGTTALFIIDQAVVFRFKLANKLGFSRNVQTRAAKNYHKPDETYNVLEAAGIGSHIPRVEVVYSLNKSETQIDDIKIVARDGFTIAWNHSLMGEQIAIFQEQNAKSGFDSEESKPKKRNFKARKDESTQTDTATELKKAEGER